MFDGLLDNLGSFFGDLDYSKIIGAAVPSAIAAYGTAGQNRQNNEFSLQQLAQKFEQDKALQAMQEQNALERARLSAAAAMGAANASAGAQRYAAQLGQQNNREALANQAYAQLMQNILAGNDQKNGALQSIVAGFNRGGF